MKVAYLDSLFSADHFSYIICLIWSPYEFIMNFQSLSIFLDFLCFLLILLNPFPFTASAMHQHDAIKQFPELKEITKLEKL